MRIVIDMQGAQTESRFRGIGRYTMAFTEAVIRNRDNHEILLVLSSVFPETIEPIRAAFKDVLPQENILVWHAPYVVSGQSPENEPCRKISELMREAFIESLLPDLVHIPSLFEGYLDGAITSIGEYDKTTPVSVTLYDLIPLLNSKHYFETNPNYKEYYQRKVKNLKNADILLAISNYTQQEGIENLNIPESKVISNTLAIDSFFHPMNISDVDRASLFEKFKITKSIVLYTGGADERKNLPRLIQAYASLASDLRSEHQLIFAGKMPEGDVVQLRHQAKSAGLKNNELVFTGYINDEELVQLYNLCELYVFPSWHEGFGLPALEAMACGAAVIGSNTSSLPEVIGREAALFDPFDVSSITKKIYQALTDRTFREKLKSDGLKQAEEFSWDKTAKQAISSWESVMHSNEQLSLESDSKTQGLIEKVAKEFAVSSLQDNDLIRLSVKIAQNQYSSHASQLLIDISELYQNDAGTGVQRVVRNYLLWLLKNPPKGFRVEPVFATAEQGYCYASQYRKKVLGIEQQDSIENEPISWRNGDLFLVLDLQHHVQLSQENFYQKLRSDGVTVAFLVYDLLPVQYPDLFKLSNLEELHRQWLAMVSKTDAAICISQATADAFDSWVKENKIKQASHFSTSWVHMGADFEKDGVSNKESKLPSDIDSALNAAQSRVSFLSVSTIEPRKRQQQIFDAAKVLWDKGFDLNLIFVGQTGWKSEHLTNDIKQHDEYGQRLFLLQKVSDQHLNVIYKNSDCLIAASLNEGFGLPLIEAAFHGVPLIARDIPVFREVAGSGAYYFKGEDGLDLADTIIAWHELYKNKKHPLSDKVKWYTWRESSEHLKEELVKLPRLRKQLLVDVSELVQRDAKSGIQRVVKNILRHWFAVANESYVIRPVYASTDEVGYCYANKFQSEFLQCGLLEVDDDAPIECTAGDIFVGLDFCPQVQISQKTFYQYLRQQGVKVSFVVYDLLCYLYPQYFQGGSETKEGFEQWLGVVIENDEAICISKSVSSEFEEYASDKTTDRLIPLKTSWFHLGADIFDNTAEAEVVEDAKDPKLKAIENSCSFLMVGTIEPRKGHSDIIDAFEILWESESSEKLVIVGKEGWLVNDLITRIRNHKELNKRLFWFEKASDKYLKQLYNASSCLIAASYGEGFGLPLIEAAQYNLSIIARDIPVFKEVAGEQAYYFDGTAASELADEILKWIELYKAGRTPESNKIPWLTWEKSANNLLELITKQELI